MQLNFFENNSFLLSDNHSEMVSKWKDSNCRACQLGNEGRKAPVIYGGDPYSNIVFIGEAPGKEEDHLGLPFVGATGKLLFSWFLEFGIDIGKKAYLTNVSKCRPSKNRTPTTKERKICGPFLLRELQLKNELEEIRLIIPLGKIATEFSLGKILRLENVIGRENDCNLPFLKEAKVFPLYHPAYQLRNPSIAPKIQKDVQKLISYF